MRKVAVKIVTYINGSPRVPAIWRLGGGASKRRNTPRFDCMSLRQQGQCGLGASGYAGHPGLVGRLTEAFLGKCGRLWPFFPIYLTEDGSMLGQGRQSHFRARDFGLQVAVYKGDG